MSILINGIKDEDKNKFAAFADKYKSQSMAALLRFWILGFIEECEQKEKQANEMPTYEAAEEAKAALAEVATTAEGEVAVTRHENNSVNIALTPRVGAPKSCPCCGADENEIDPLGRPPLVTVRSKEDWGSWACHKCNSTGRWYDDKPPITLYNGAEESAGEE